MKSKKGELYKGKNRKEEHVPGGRLTGANGGSSYRRKRGRKKPAMTTASLSIAISRLPPWA